MKFKYSNFLDGKIFEEILCFNWLNFSFAAVQKTKLGDNRRNGCEAASVKTLC